MNRFFIFIALMQTSCSHHYIYSGRAQVLDSENNQREAIVYWTKTDHVLRQADQAETSIKLKTQCSTVTINFNETSDGIFFLNSDKKNISFNNASETPERCGEIVGFKSIKEIEPGSMELKIQCRPKSGPMSLPSARRYIAAKNSPYVFNILRTEAKPGQAPEVAACKTKTSELGEK